MRSAQPEPAIDATGTAFAANLVTFARFLRRAGIATDPAQTREFARALALTGLASRRDVRAAGRAIYVHRHDQRALYDAAFDLFWRRSTLAGGPTAALPRVRQTAESIRDAASITSGGGEDVTDLVDTSAPRAASSMERLRHLDFAELTPDESKDAAALIAQMRPRLPLRPARRPRIDASGARPAGHRILRRSLGTGGEAVHWFWLARRRRPRPIVLILDVSGSMERYSRFLLRFAHALGRAGAPLEAFVFSTRLTRITRALRHHDPDTALQRAAATVSDWSSGTRIGASLRELNRRWVRRAVRSGAVVLLVSDGWERDDPAILGSEMATLQRSCHRLLWLDPLASRPGFEPATQGLRAAMPFVDAFLPCANIASLESLARRLTADS